MIFFRNAFVGSPVALAFVAGLTPSATAAPWWPMHYVMEEVPPDLQSTQLDSTTAVAITLPSSTATPSAISTTTSAEVLAGSTGSAEGLDASMQQTSSASAGFRAGSTTAFAGSTIMALYLAL
ncbi:hypothetical protein DAEQUDRAFT_813169 [Daedalea quercina L-15889]|uniref:Uncharacterized protein n=1 Tax=Daedalea quercina L-15889 TaxID=1314783 RepID=A0A165NJ57_9APHY|nr:hypothetical protein DAEQUDRAFT_813169 [Daedalea quercina L-15889]